MKYWLLTTEFPPIHGGGISTYCWHTAKMLANSGIEVTVFINDYQIRGVKKSNAFTNCNIIQFEPRQVKIGSALGQDARLSLEFSNILEIEMEKSGVPDILEVQDYLGIGYYTLQKKHLLYPLFKDLRILLTMHAPSFLYWEYNQVPYYKFPQYFVGEMEKASIKMADLVISPSNYLLSELEPRMEIKETNPIQLFNPYESEWLEKPTPEYTPNDLVFFGKLTPQKGCLEMLSYLKEMWDNGFDIPIHIIGGGNHFFYPVGEDMDVHIQKRFSTYIDKNLIRFEGNLSPEKLNKRLKAAHIVIIPSIVDNLPYAAIEAMAMGKIVLCSASGGQAEIIENNKSGFIFNHLIECDFQEKLHSILDKSSDELKRIGLNAKDSIQKITNYEIILNRKLELIKKQLKTDNHKKLFPFINTISKSLINPIDNNEITPNKLSIVIPYYNMGEFIEDTLKSLQKISYKNYEVLLINDGSTNSESIMKLAELGKKYDIRIYNKKNEGLPKTRNFGAKECKGEYLAFLDADDTVSPDYYERAIEILVFYENVSFVGCWAKYFGESKSTWPTFNPEPPYLLTHNTINSSALIYKREDFLNFGLNDPKMIYGMEDYDSVISMVKNGARGVSFPEIWWQYRIRKNSMAQSFTKDKQLFLYRLISKKHGVFFKKYNEELTNLLNHNNSGIYFDNPTKPLLILNSGLRALIYSKMIQLMKKNKTIRHFSKKIYQRINR